MRNHILIRRSSALLLGLILALTGQVTLAGTVTYYHTDAQGSPVMASDINGNIIWRKQYEPYGKEVNGVPDDVGYTGHEHDEETGLTYMQARYQDPIGGRFLAIDPVGFKPSQPMTFNRYSYANNNPYKYVDPDGEKVVVNSRHVKNSMGMGSHTFTTVTSEDDVSTTISSYSTDVDGTDMNTITINNPSDVGADVTITDSVTIKPPDGMTEAEFDQAVLKQADAMKESGPAEYEMFPDNSSEGNCHTTTRNLIEGAGGQIPENFNPEGLNPDLHEDI